jgi:hypothetical protein
VAGVIDLARKWLEQETQAIPPSRFIIRAAFPMTLHARPSHSESLFRDDVLLVVTATGGYVTLARPLDASVYEHIIGADVRAIDTVDPQLEWACIDAGLQAVPQRATYVRKAVGTIDEKSEVRSHIIADEVARLGAGSTRNVLIIGVVSSMVEELARRGHTMILRDLDPSLTGKLVGGYSIPPGRREQTLESIATADVCVVTGMTLVNDTFDDIATEAQRYSVPLVMYAQSCSSVASRLPRTGLVAVSVCEPWPNYFFPGATSFDVYRSEDAC